MAAYAPRSMTTPGPPAGRCWSCAHAIDADDRYCRRCGRGQGAFLDWYYRPVWIAVLALTALGPFALPLVWRTPLLDRTGKVIGSVALAAVTVWITLELVEVVGALAPVLTGL